MTLININNLTFSYDTSYDNIFENVSFQIDTNWKLGLTGRNGRGKTTFLNLLMGKYEFSGSIQAPVAFLPGAAVAFDYFPYEVGDKNCDTITIIERIVPFCPKLAWLGKTDSSERSESEAQPLPQYELWKLQRELSLLDVEEEVLYRPFATLSNGEQTKVLLAALFLKESNFLLIDEPTNHLDMDAREKVGQYLNSKKGFILVSHDRAFLDQCVDHILSINRNCIETQRGNFSAWQQSKELQDRFELVENEKRKREIKALKEAARRTADWSDKIEKTKNGTKLSGVKPDKGHIGHQAAKMMKRSKTLEGRQENAIAEKAKLLKNIETADSLAIKPRTYHSSRLIEAQNLAILYDGRRVVKDVDFSINTGDRIALIGKNGSGKSSILKLLMGEDISYEGSLRIGSNLVISYISQDTSFLKGNLKDFARREDIEESLFKAILCKLDFSRVQFEKNLTEFSEGQKKKVLIAKSLCQQAHLYIWDEPLNFVDVISRMQIEELLLNHKPTMIFVEHDRAFSEKIATKQIFL